MDDEMDPVEQISFLSRSKTRVGVLERLRADGATTQRDLRDRLDASRSTITRSLTALEEHGWIEQTDQSYQLTPKGEIVAEEFTSLVDSVRVVDELSTFLRWFPYREFSVDISDLRDGEVTSAGSADPYAPARKQTELLEEVDSFRGWLPSLDIEGTRVVHEQITERAFEAEVVVSEAVEDTIEAGEYATLFGEMISTDRLTVLVVEKELPFYLGLSGEIVQIGVEDDEGFPRALLQTTAHPVRNWAADIYGSYRERARVKTLEEF